MDCSNIITYMHEEKRMCKWYYDSVGCEKCPFGNNTNCSCYKLFNNHHAGVYVGESHIKTRIEIVQKWSDEHPEWRW